MKTYYFLQYKLLKDTIWEKMKYEKGERDTARMVSTLLRSNFRCLNRTVFEYYYFSLINIIHKYLYYISI